MSTGIAGLDLVLDGGLPEGRTYLIHGEPGVGKTTLALQFLLDGAARGEPCVYVGLSESQEEIVQIAASHGWSLGGITLTDLRHPADEAGSDYTFFHPSEIELRDTTDRILEVVDEVDPRRIVFDSLSELRMMARESLRYRRQILFLKRLFADRGTTVMLLDSLSDHQEAVQAATLAGGVLRLQKDSRQYGPPRRRLRVEKLRGATFREGFHDFELMTGGLTVHPRLREPAPPVDPGPAVGRPFLSGLDGLDALTGGGFHWGSVTMLLGPAGVGKSTLAARYVMAALAQKEKAAVFLFEEDERKWIQRARWLGFDAESFRGTGGLMLERTRPAELSPGHLSGRIARAVAEGARLVVIDGLNGFLASSMEGESLLLHLHDLFSYLSACGALTFVTEAQSGVLGERLAEPFEVSFLADSVLLLRYFEAFGSLRKAVAVVKKRTGPHEQHIRELHFGPNGLEMGDPLVDFQGVLTGRLTYVGERDELLDAS